MSRIYAPLGSVSAFTIGVCGSDVVINGHPLSRPAREQFQRLFMEAERQAEGAQEPPGG